MLPNDVKKESEKSGILHQIINTVNVLLVFKGKQLIPDQLFDQNTISKILKSESADNGAYYKAILQNLFLQL